MAATVVAYKGFLDKQASPHAEPDPTLASAPSPLKGLPSTARLWPAPLAQEAVDVFVLQATGGELASKQLSSPPTITRQASGDEGGSQRCARRL
eukprot:3493949-Prymnesium_polylepis.1